MTPVCHRCFLIQRVALSRFVLTWERGSLVNDMLGEENATTSQISAVTGIIAAKHYHGDTNRIAIHPFITAQRGLILINQGRNRYAIATVATTAAKRGHQRMAGKKFTYNLS